MEPADLGFVMQILLWSAFVFALACLVEWLWEKWRRKHQ